MPGNQRIDSIIDQKSTGEELTILLTDLKDAAKLIREFPKIGSVYKDSSSHQELKKATEDLIKTNTDSKKKTDDLSLSLREYEKTVNQNAQAQAKLNVGQSDAAKQLATTREQVRLQSLEVKNQTTMQQAAEGSIVQMRAQLSLLIKQYDGLSAAERNSIKGQNLQAQVEGQVNALKKLEAETGRFQRNVGNYTGAVKILEKGLQDVKMRMDNLTQAGKGHSEEMAQLESEYELLGTMVNKQSQGFTTLSREVMMMSKQLETMANAGMQSSTAFKELETAFVAAKSEMKEFQLNQQLLTSPAAGLQAMTLSAKALGGVYATSAGAAALFANGNEKVEKELQKLMAIMTILQGLNEIHEFVEKRGAIATIFRAGAEKLKNFVMTGSTRGIEENTVAMGVNTTVMEGTTIATKATTAAMVGLRFALIATGIGALILLLPMFAHAMKGAGEETEKSRKKLKEFEVEEEEAIKQQKLLNDVTTKAADSYGTERAALDTLVNKLKDEHIPRKQKIELIKEIQDKYPGYFDGIKTEKDLVDKLPGAYERAAQGILLKAKAEAGQGLIGENYKNRLKEEIDYNNKSSELNGRYVQAIADMYDNVSGEKARSMMKASIDTQFQTESNNIVNDYKDKVTEIDKTNRFLAKSINDSNDQIIKLGGTVTDGGKDKKEKKTEDFTNDLIKQQEELLKAKSELSKFEIESDMKKQLKIAENEQNSLHDRLTAYSHYLADKKTLDDKQKEEELSLLKIKLDKIAQIEKIDPSKRTSDQKKLLLEKETLLIQEEVIVKKHAGAIEDINTEVAEKTAAVFKKAAEETKAAMEETINSIKSDKLLSITEEETIALDALNRKFAEGKMKVEDYDKAKQKISTDARIKQLQAEKDAVEDQIFTYEALYLNTSDLEKKSLELHNQIEEQKTGKTKDEAQKRAELEKQQEDKKKEIRDKSYELGVAIFDGGVTKRLNRIQDEIDANTKLKDSEIERINSSALSEQDKAAKIAQITAQAQAKQDALEKKKRDTELKQAKFDRDAQVLKITGDAIAAHFKLISQMGAAGIPLAIENDIMAALQIGILLAKPLPKFETGTSYSPEGYALTDEKGAELYIPPSGQPFMGNDQPTVRYLEQGTRIIPHDEMNQVLMNMMLSKTAKYLSGDKSDKKLSELKDVMLWQTNEFKKAIAGQKRTTVVNNHIDMGWIDYLKKNVYD